MNFQYYLNYIAIVEAGSLTAAARRLRVAQPALSNQVKALEETYGTRLFYRGSGSHRLELTEAGRILFDQAKRMVEAEETAKREIAKQTAGTPGALRLGIINTFGSHHQLRALELFCERYPDTKLYLREASEPELMEQMYSGMLDVALVRADRTDFEAFDTVFVLRDSLVAAYQKGAFFMGNASESVSIPELAKFPLCAPEEQVGLLRTAFRANGVAFVPKMVGSSVNTCLQMAQSGKCVALVPELMLQLFEMNRLPFKRIAGKPINEASFALIAQKAQYRSRATSDFIAIVNALQEEQGNGLRSEQTERPNENGGVEQA